MTRRTSASLAPASPPARGRACERAAAVDDELARLYPGARCSLVHDGPFQLLVATVLSAQTTDRRVNALTPALFARHPDAAALAGADPEALEEELRPLGMQRTRARRLIALGAALVDSCDGAVPALRDELVALPGVGRKTANVVLGDAFGVPAITVDTHVGRLARRLGWTGAKDPLAVGGDIASLWELGRWTDGCHRRIERGFSFCRPRAPRCERCALGEKGLCPRVGV